jgi:hypothetical protein
MRDQSAQTDVTTDPTVIADGTFTKTATTISFACPKAVGTYTQMGIEILDNAGAVIKRAVAAFGAAAPTSTVQTATISGLTANTAYHCRGFRGDEGLAAL